MSIVSQHNRHSSIDIRHLVMAQFNFSTDLEVRFRDLDAFGHVNNAVFLTYFEVARMHYWKSVFGENPYLDIRFLVVRAECDYRVQARLGDLLRIAVRVSLLKNSSFVFDYQVTHSVSGSLVAEGKTVQVFFDHETQRSRPIPSEVRAKIKEFEGSQLD
ncbi:MAG: thioesterase family protein [Terriglobia bacterium]